jgi:hypothetical protein
MRASASGERCGIEAATKQMGTVLRIWKIGVSDRSFRGALQWHRTADGSLSAVLV